MPPLMRVDAVGILAIYYLFSINYYYYYIQYKSQLMDKLSKYYVNIPEVNNIKDILNYTLILNILLAIKRIS